VKEIERWPWITSGVPDTEPAIIVSWVQDEGKTIMNLGDEFVGFGGDQGKGLQ
jgi:hypothetical protein